MDDKLPFGEEEVGKELRDKALKDARNKTLGLAQAFRHSFTTEFGKIVLNDLEAKYGPDLFFGCASKDNNEKFDIGALTYNSGSRQVVDYIKNMMDMSANPEKYFT